MLIVGDVVWGWTGAGLACYCFGLTVWGCWDGGWVLITCGTFTGYFGTLFVFDGFLVWLIGPGLTGLDLGILCTPWECEWFCVVALTISAFRNF